MATHRTTAAVLRLREGSKVEPKIIGREPNKPGWTSWHMERVLQMTTRQCFIAMKKILSTRNAMMNIPLILALTPCTVLAQWVPNDALASIPQIEDCARTGGDIAISIIARTGRVIYYCSASAARINAITPGAGHFYFVHEYGHQALSTSDEAAADWWAAAQLANAKQGAYFLNAAISHFILRAQCGEPSNPRYGTPMDRVNRIIQSAQQANPMLLFDQATMQFN